MSRLLWPNLDAELQWALEEQGLSAAPRGFRRQGEPGPLVLRALLFGFLGECGDRLRLPARGFAERIRLGPSLRARGLSLVEGGDVRLRRDEELLPWAWTEALSQLAQSRSPGRAHAEKHVQAQAKLPRKDWARRIRAWNDRFRWAPLDRDRHAGRAVSADEVQVLLGSFDSQDPWVLKARWAAAGRLRLRGMGPKLSEDEGRHLSRLLELSGGVVLERWDESLEECGLSLQIEEDSVAMVGAHELAGRAGPRLLKRREEALPAETREEVRTCAEELRREGYCGPLGLDLRRRSSESPWRIGDVNLRHCFGHVLHASGFDAISFGPPPEEGDWEELVAMDASPEDSLFARRPPE